MSYCVNCGVELSPESKKCPLCDTPIFNCKNDEINESQSAYSDKIVIPKNVRKRFSAVIASMVILIPNIVCLMSNLLFFKESNWSFYIASASALFWVVFIFPFLTKKLRPFLMWGFNTVAIAAYVFFFYAIKSSGQWYLKCAVPIICTVSLAVFVYMIWVRKKRRSVTAILIHLVSDFIVCSLAFGGTVSLYRQSLVPIHVCSIISTSLVALLVFFIVCNSSEKMKAWISRNFFVE